MDRSQARLALACGVMALVAMGACAKLESGAADGAADVTGDVAGGDVMGSEDAPGTPDGVDVAAPDGVDVAAPDGDDATPPSDGGGDAGPDVAGGCGAQSGAELYASRCAACHGDDLQGWHGDPARLGPGLAGDGLQAWWFDLVRAGSKGRYGELEMIPYDAEAIPDADLQAALAFIVAADDAGSEAYKAKCSGCHGPDPADGGIGPALAGAGLVDQWTAQIAERKAPEGEPQMPPFPDLCEQDRRALAEYLVGSTP